MAAHDKWNWSNDEIRRVGYRVVDMISDYLTGLPDLPAGGLSGRPLRPIALERVEAIRRRLGKRIAIVGCGGVDDVASANAMFQAGADLVQLYTGLVFRGPALPGLLSRQAKARPAKGSNPSRPP